MNKCTLGIENMAAAVGRRARRWHRWPSGTGRQMAVSLSIAAVLEACNGGGCRGNPPSGPARVVLSLAAVAPASANCTSRDAGGAGITGVSIAVERAGGQSGCVPVTFLRARGTTQLGTYVANDCSAPPITSCIETDETLTVPSMEPGSYLIHVVGQIGTRACWRADETLDVAPGGTLGRTLSLVHQDIFFC